jgi:spore coat-associated protein N
MHAYVHSSSKRRLSRRLALTAVVLLAGVGFIGGVFANFTDTQAAGPETINTGIVHIVLGTPAGDHGSVTTGPINPMAEGDTVTRVVQLTNNTTVGAAGTTGLAVAPNGLTLQTTTSGANASSDIVTDTTNGLHVTVQACATSPTETGPVAGPWTYTCSGGFSTPVNNVPLKTLNTTASDLTASAPNEGASEYYVIAVTLPTSLADAWGANAGACSTGLAGGPNEQLQACTLNITYNITATQRAGTAQ